MAVIAAVSLTAIGIHSAPEAARTTATAIAEIIGVRSGIASTSNFEVGLPPVSGSQVVIEVSASSKDTTERLSRALNQARVVSQPATFSVSGEPFQVFSVAVPKQRTRTSSTSANGEQTVVVFSDYQHSAGMSPTIGGDGKSVFAVGARVEVGPGTDSFAEDAPLLDFEEGAAVPDANEGSDDFSATEDEDPVVGAVEQNDDGQSIPIDTETSSKDGLEIGSNDAGALLTSSGTNDGTVTAALRQYNPFSFSVDPRFLNVLVSYN